MRLGAQVSVSGGMFNAFANAKEIGADTMMFYTRSNRQWKAKPITIEDQEKYKATAAENADIFPAVVHANYLMNLASPEEDKWAKSYEAMVDEITRTGQIGVNNMVVHPGSHMVKEKKPTEQQIIEWEWTGLDRIVKGVKMALEATAETSPGVTICLETMAGQGTNLGYKFEHLGYLIKEINGGDRVGVCFDTCHVFTAGYDIRTPETYAQVMADFDRIVGLEHIKCFHFNDSKFDLGSRKDRHQHIGKGFLGEQAFANLVNDPRWADYPAHLETPKSEDNEETGESVDMDPVNLATLRSLIK
ncbi:MAG: deoxyribonuclease-4 [Cellvibrionaceae bacterium]|jgi:deoxyribonuclease-4